MENRDKYSFKADCTHFRGDLPCKPHKANNYHCPDCPVYNPKSDIILIIKLGAVGDVIRTTPLLSKIRSEHPQSAIWWLTMTPDVVPASVDKVFPMNLESILTLQSTGFFKVINLDKDNYACGLTSQLKADHKYGYQLSKGKPAPINSAAMPKYITGLFDDANKENTKSYPEEIFEICGWKFAGEDYELDCDRSIKWDIPSQGKKIIGLNTGCGGRWVTRLLPDSSWIALIRLLRENGYFPLLLGGSQEHEKNKLLAEKTGACYLGHFSFSEFISLVGECDTVVTAVTMALHIVIGLHIPVVLMNNIFNPNEFELYGRGEIIQPEKECICYFSPTCKNPDYFCMEHMSPKAIFEAVQRAVK